MMLAASTPRPAGLLPVRHCFMVVSIRIQFADTAIAQHTPALAKFETACAALRGPGMHNADTFPPPRQACSQQSFPRSDLA